MLVIQTQGTRFATQGRETAQGNLKTNNHGHVQHHEPCNHEPRTHAFALLHLLCNECPGIQIIQI